jgi:hypothetical protein
VIPAGLGAGAGGGSSGHTGATSPARINKLPLSGFGFQPVVKKRIVRLAWEQWDRSAAEPAEYPAEGEPENYVLGRRHDPELAEAIGPLWELLVETEDVAEGQPDFLRDTQYFSSIYVSAAARDWLAARAGEWLRFEDPSSPDPV